MEKGEEQSSKKARVVESPTDQVKEEVLDGDEATGEGARVSAEGATATTGMEVKITIDMDKLHCPICTLPFKPPILQCAEGHLACGACHGQLPDKDRCCACGHAGGCRRDISMEDVVRCSKTTCRYASYGCLSSVTYYDTGTTGAPDRTRPAAARSPAAASPHQLRLPAESQPRRLLVAEEDGRVFLLSVAATLRGVSLEFARAGAALAAASTMGKTQQQSSKKPRVEELPMAGHAKTEVEILEEDEATAQDTLVAVEGDAAGVEITVRIAKAKLHCPVCTLPLKPPIFQCAVGHLACGVCRGQLPGNDRCLVCGIAGAYGRSTALEDMVRSTRIQCPYGAYGCRSYVTYYAAAEHSR
ncbi:hypothetical protein BAE44_0012395, partial [Dichanthelium oligosanthes]